MFVFAIETCGKTVALIQEDNSIMLEGVLNGDREEGRILRRGFDQVRGNRRAQPLHGMNFPVRTQWEWNLRAEIMASATEEPRLRDQLVC